MTQASKKKIVKALIKKWSEKMMLHEWDIIFDVVGKSNSGAAATVNVDAVYRNAAISVYDCAFVFPNKIEDIIKHELVHLLTEPLYDACYDLSRGRLRTQQDISDQREYVTERISRILK